MAKKDTEEKVKEEKAPKPPVLCYCGCGGQTGGGKFLPGHDAKHKSNLYTMLDGDNASDQEIARDELVAMGWGHLMNQHIESRSKVAAKKAVAAEHKAEIEAGAEKKRIERATARKAREEVKKLEKAEHDRAKAQKIAEKAAAKAAAKAEAEDDADADEAEEVA